MRVNLRRRIAFVAALIVPAVAVLALSASPALAALPRYGRLVLGTHHTVSPLAILFIALGTAAGTDPPGHHRAPQVPRAERHREPASPSRRIRLPMPQTEGAGLPDPASPL